MSDLARRLAAHPRFEWVEGMMAVHPDHSDIWYRVLRSQEGAAISWTDEDCDIYRADAEPPATDGGDWPSDVIPHLPDPATAGCLLSLLPELAPHLYYVHLEGSGAKADLSDNVTVGLRDGSRHSGACLGEAVAVALLWCWGVP